MPNLQKCVLADPTHTLPMPDRDMRLFRPSGETVDVEDPFWASLIGDKSIRRASDAEQAAAAPDAADDADGDAGDGGDSGNDAEAAAEPPAKPRKAPRKGKGGDVPSTAD